MKSRGNAGILQIPHQIGTHNVEVQVDDGKGRTATQTFTLSGFTQEALQFCKEHSIGTAETIPFLQHVQDKN